MELKIINELLTNDEYFNEVFSKLNEDMFTKYDELFRHLKNYNDEYKYSSESIEEFKAYLCMNNYSINLNLNKFYRNNEIFLKLTEKFISGYKPKEKKDLGIDFVLDFKKDVNDDKIIAQNYIKTTSRNMNHCIGDGFIKGRSYLFLGKTNIGKSLLLCSLASDLYQQGYNVLYISAELNLKSINQRIKANFLDVNIKDLCSYSLEDLECELNNKIKKSKIITNSLKLKYYPPHTASVNNIKSYLKDLKEDNFVPDVIVLDYITMFKSINYNKIMLKDYEYIKSIIEEFQTFTAENDISLITAMQLNRTGSSNKIKDLDIINTAGSWDSISQLDFVGILFQDEELREKNKIQIKVGKTRSSDNNNQIYDFDINYKKMKIS